MNKYLTILLIAGIAIFVLGQFTFNWIAWIGFIIMLIPILVMIYYAIINFYKDIFK